MEYLPTFAPKINIPAPWSIWDIYTAQNGVKRDPTIPLIPLLCLVNVHDLPSGYD